MDDELATCFIIVEQSPQLTSEQLAGLTRKDQWQPPHFFDSSPDHWRMYNVYRHLIIALDQVVQNREVVPGAYQSIHAPTPEEFRDLDRTTVFLLCPKALKPELVHFDELLTQLTKSDLYATFSLEEGEIRRRFSPVPVSDEVVQKVQRVLQRQKVQLHYEFAHQAQVEENNQD